MAARDHGGQQQPRQLGQRHDVDLEDVADPCRVAAIKTPGRPEPGIVDQGVDRETAPRDLVGEARGCAGLRKIGRDHRHRAASLAQLAGERLHRRDAARRQNQIMPMPRQLARQRRANAARGAGDEGEGARGGVHVRSFVIASAAKQSRA